MVLNALPTNKILAFTKLKAFAGKKINIGLIHAFEVVNICPKNGLTPECVKHEGVDHFEGLSEC